MRAVAIVTSAVVLLVSTGAMGEGDPKAGQQKAALCAGCHLAKGEGSGLNPELAGQTVQYFTYALNAYKSGQRQHPGMNAIAKGLSDQDIADLAAFYHSLK